jgi:hypothetical protein
VGLAALANAVDRGGSALSTLDPADAVEAAAPVFADPSPCAPVSLASEAVAGRGMGETPEPCSGSDASFSRKGTNLDR